MDLTLRLNVLAVCAAIVFVGAHILPTPMDPWNVNCIARLPNLRLVTSAPWQGSMAAAFAIIK